ncbi:MAG: hypothetical protein AW09_001623 [Candidatus Accumulibacter phosphatis]|uniref:Uncharacterized protein n=1 Tax=Candidatus Accumulibacter phosphatis TaxID=327160 RepID=A0A080M7R7_9PROT|nr:MAG: hypothetical protein AW09_001623 [Candidatus Accumulibacter phosphatis]
MLAAEALLTRFLLAPRPVQRLLEEAAHQAIEQHRRHGDEEPALQCAGEKDPVRILEKPGHRLVGEHDPESGKDRVDEDETQGGAGWRWSGRRLGRPGS